ncbi:hypothetical protein PIB30_073669 [Stylosanthes scabra]|uniref:Secreted protein n=1 Tax=Stylosanthes scabra TaxID=79078 RepID=A0ABU6ZNC0_9FABA|nr:hypothetical protein [Stylosanthes scabra]
MAMRTHRLIWCVRIGSRFGLQAFLCDLLVPRALFSHFRFELCLLKPETLERTQQGIVRNATIRAKVAKESVRNEKITKKSLEARFRGLCVRTKADVRTHCHGGRHVQAGTGPYALKCTDDLSCRFLRATDGRNVVSLEAVNATPLPITGGP